MFPEAAEKRLHTTGHTASRETSREDDKGGVMSDRELQKAGTLERKYFKRHWKQTGCNGQVAEWRGPWLFRIYYCKKCGKRMTV